MINVLVVEAQSMARALFEMYVKSDSKYSLLASVSSADLALSLLLKPVKADLQ